MKSVCVIVDNSSFQQRKDAFLKNHETCCSSAYSVATAKTELSSSVSSIADHSDHSYLDTDSRHRIVCFALDEYNNVKEEVFIYPSIDDSDKKDLFWSQKEVSRRRRERDLTVESESETRSHFIACVEELFSVPMRKRLVKKSIYSESDPSVVIDSVSPLSQEEAVLGLCSSDYRRYEHRCVRVIVGLRRR